MSQQLKNIVFFGASGNIGTPLLSALFDAKTFNVTAVSRTASDATFPACVQVHKTDMSDDDLLSVLKGKDAVVSALGPTAFTDQKKLIDLSIKAGVKRFLPSEFSIHTDNEAVRELVPIFKVKWDVVEYLIEKEKEGLTWTAIAVGFLFDWGMQQGIFGFNLSDHSATIWDDGNTRFSATNMATARQALVSVLERSAETANQYIHIASLTTTQNEILKVLKSVSSAEWKITNTTTEAQVKTAHDLIGQGNFMGFLFLAQASTLGNTVGLKANYETEEKVWNKELGLPVDEDLTKTLEGIVGDA